MSTNFYAHWNIASNLILKLHIGKRVNKGLSTMSGAVFPTLRGWEEFLTHNVNTVTVVDEYGLTYTTHDFIRDEFRKPGSSDTQIAWLEDNGYMIHNKPVIPTYQDKGYWLDEGQLFYGGTFS